MGIYITDRGKPDLKQENIMKPALLDRLEAAGFTVYDGQDFLLNIIGVRTRGNSNAFDDTLHVIYRCNGLWQHEQFLCTTDPGRYYLVNPLNNAGCAVVSTPQQMQDAFYLGLRGDRSYHCLRQRKPVKVWRDGNRDSVIDYAELTDSSSWGIQIHRASAQQTVTNIGRYSAGCTVIANPHHYDRFIDLCRAQIAVSTKETFTYTLLEEL